MPILAIPVRDAMAERAVIRSGPIKGRTGNSPTMPGVLRNRSPNQVRQPNVRNELGLADLPGVVFPRRFPKISQKVSESGMTRSAREFSPVPAPQA
jgi:hypothetical protein